MRKIILENRQAPGDILMLTAAVRDLHRCNPGKFLTDVRTTASELWRYNPNITPLRDSEANSRIVCKYPLVHQSNRTPFHFINGFERFIGQRLRVRIDPLGFKGDIYLSESEKTYPSLVKGAFHEVGCPYWLIVAGGKYDFTIKWWETSRFQEVIDFFKGELSFVQIGRPDHHHPVLDGVVDLRGKTSLRDLVQLVYHSDGVLCPVTFVMHLAAAVEARPGTIGRRPCIVVSGGREPPHWEAYPHHQFIHTVGALPCCAEGGCWRSRTLPLSDGEEHDRPENLCVDVVGSLPRCMDMIRSEDVIRRIEYYLQ